MQRLIIILIIFLFTMNQIKSQINPEIMRRVNANITGFELAKFLEGSESIKLGIIVDKVEGLDLECKLLFDKLPVKMQYPNNSIQLFGFRRTGLHCGEIIKTTTVHDGHLNNIFLIGIDTSSQELAKRIKFISGQMFLDNISFDFQLDNDEPSTFTNYIKLRMFDLQIDEVVFLKRKRGFLFFQAYSNLEEKELKLSVDIKSETKEIKIEKWL